MSPAHVFEPTYQGLKERLKTGLWPMGMRLETAKLADELGVSVTPVRDSLNRLVGERLVELWPGEGYRVARISERLLRDLLVFNCDLLAKALVSAPFNSTNAEWSEQADAYPDRVARLFAEAAAASGNAIMAEVVDALNDRLHPVRCLDLEMIADCDTEIAAFEEMMCGNGDSAASIDWLNLYHDRRSELASEYVHRLETGPNPT